MVYFGGMETGRSDLVASSISGETRTRFTRPDAQGPADLIPDELLAKREDERASQINWIVVIDECLYWTGDGYSPWFSNARKYESQYDALEAVREKIRFPRTWRLRALNPPPPAGPRAGAGGRA